MSRQSATTGPREARQVVLATKIAPPPSRPEHIPRERLFEQLDIAATRRLTLVSAHTGFGKTTLLSEWTRKRSGRTAWFTITPGDSDTVRLMAGIVASLDGVGALKKTDVDRDLVAPAIDVVDDVLPRMFDALDGEPIVLVLDDYHILSGVAAHELIEACIAGMPASMHVVIATRTDPSLPLGRLRASGAMAEIRADQLRFDTDEADRFLNGSLGLDLERNSLETLEARTEGWPAGLYLAALTLRARSDRARFVSEFAGSNRHVVDYLSSEVLDRLPSDDRAFLLRTSILERLSGPVCDVVTGMAGSTARLRDLERANLFIVPLDESGNWFRFHRLFAELLRSELLDESPDLVPELHRRAAIWHAERELVEAAVEHALAAGDRELAGTLLARSWRDLVRTGQFQTLERLLKAIGDERGRLAGPLAVVEAISAGMLGRDPRVIERLVATANESGWTGPTPDGYSIDALGALAIASFGGADLDRQEAAARHLLEGYPENSEAANTGRSTLGMILTLRGDLTGALAVLEPINELPNIPQVEMYAAAARALALGEIGDPIGAEGIAKASLARAEGWGLAKSRVAGALCLALGRAKAHQGKPRDALPWLERALTLWGVPGTLFRAQCLIPLASVYGAIGEPVKARASAREAREIVDASPSAGALPSHLAEIERRLRVVGTHAYLDGDTPSVAEIRVLRLLASPLSAREIAAELYISINTVKTHSKALHQKLGTSSRGETVERAKQLGLL